MNFFKSFFFVTLSLVLLSCTRFTTVIYYNDNSKVDDGEIFGESLSTFFNPDPNIYVKKLHSKDLNDELKKIKDSLSLFIPTDELDDGYYGYAFITASQDTLFADYGLNYWKLNRTRHKLFNEKLKSEIKQLFENPYLK